MANPEHVEIVKKGTEAINSWNQKHPNEILDLRGADLGNLQLTTLGFGTELTSADLTGANLRYAFLINVNLSHVKFVEDNLKHAKFVVCVTCQKPTCPKQIFLSRNSYELTYSRLISLRLNQQEPVFITAYSLKPIS